MQKRTDQLAHGLDAEAHAAVVERVDVGAPALPRVGLRIVASLGVHSGGKLWQIEGNRSLRGDA